MRRTVVALLAVIGLIAGASTAKATDAPTRQDPGTFPNVLKLDTAKQKRMQARVDDALKVRPGGVQISQYEVSWPQEGVVLALTPPGSKSAPPASRAALGVDDSKAFNLRAGADPNKIKAGDVVLSPTGTSNSCPYEIGGTKWYCWYVDLNFEGDRFQFSYRYCNGSYVNLADWGRSNQASSWVNNSNYYINVYDYTNATGFLWTENPVSNNWWVGSVLNDRASSFTAC